MTFDMSSVFATAHGAWGGPPQYCNMNGNVNEWERQQYGMRRDSVSRMSDISTRAAMVRNISRLVDSGNVHCKNGQSYGSNPNLMGMYGTMNQMPIEQPKAENIQGFGKLTWLSSKAGVITTPQGGTISFQIKDFCDQMLADLTSVLRVGFTLSFTATLNENAYTATLVQPLYGADADKVFADPVEVDLEAAAPTPPSAKDAYLPELEARAIPALLHIFQRHGLPQIQLASLHSHMSNCGDEEMSRYVGTSSLKRRQFVERRTHIFRITHDDTMSLQSPAVYLCVLRLASYLLRRGGTTAIQSLYEFYVGPDMTMEIREMLGGSRQDFLKLILEHPWIFALYPNRTYVAVKRNLPHYDYPAFIKQHFSQLDVLRPPSAHRQPAGFGQAPRPISRSMSAHQPLTGMPPPQTRGGAPPLMANTAMPANNARPGNLWENAQPPLARNMSMSSPTDAWSPAGIYSPGWGQGVQQQQQQQQQLPTPNGIPAHRGLPTPQGVFGAYNAPRLVDAAVQTEPSRTDSGCCSCGCTCGGRPVLSRASVGSVSPPSIESGSPSQERLSPPSTASSLTVAAPVGQEQTPGQPMKLYNMFETNNLLAGLGSFSLN